ncbi:MAG: hypothetical protein HXX10_04475 [Rhodoplanes sp.]|uniref:hypothetical protein n=1 Tax=Rhodoplanes sp. TaxID=1968906 RepID=UPI00179651E2|nr:hypothetical protein [Rhodoplanes sp.]NVO13271.1 hypothetical protein [Rhodoplanes sp.]
MSADLLSLPPAVQAAVCNEVQPRERIVYAGQPSPRSALLPTLPIFIFGIAWMTFVIVWEGSAIGLSLGLWGRDQAGGDMPTLFGLGFTLFGLPFVLIGLGMLAAPLVAAVKAARSVHVVTDQRMFTLRARPWRTVVSHFGQEITAIERTDGDGGRGHLKLSRGSARDSDGDLQEVYDWWRGIPEVRRAETAVRDLVKARSTAG